MTRVLLRAGAHVVIADIDLIGARRADELGGDAVASDVIDPDSASEILVAIKGLDLLVNNAGSYCDNGSILDQDYEAWRCNVTVTFDGVIVCPQVAA